MGKTKKKIYSFKWDVGRMGILEGLFVAYPEDIDSIIDKEIYFGEVLGKHSEIFGTIRKGDFEILSYNKTFTDDFIFNLGEGTIIGTNPFDYLDEEEDE